MRVNHRHRCRPVLPGLVQCGLEFAELPQGILETLYLLATLAVTIDLCWPELTRRRGHAAGNWDHIRVGTACVVRIERHDRPRRAGFAGCAELIRRFSLGSAARHWLKIPEVKLVRPKF